MCEVCDRAFDVVTKIFLEDCKFENDLAALRDLIYNDEQLKFVFSRFSLSCAVATKISYAIDTSISLPSDLAVTARRDLTLALVLFGMKLAQGNKDYYHTPLKKVVDRERLYDDLAANAEDN